MYHGMAVYCVFNDYAFMHLVMHNMHGKYACVHTRVYMCTCFTWIGMDLHDEIHGLIQ